MTSLYKAEFGRESMTSFPEAIRKEWVVTNGIGGYAGSSIIGANTRKHHGLLVASFHAPTDRFVLLNRIDEQVVFNDKTVSFSSVQRKKKHFEDGFRFQTGFSFDVIPTFTYFVDGVLIKKTVAMEYGKNTVAIRYEVENMCKDCVLSLAPVFNFRNHNDGSRRSDLRFSVSCKEREIVLISKKNKEKPIRFYSSSGAIVNNDKSDVFDKEIELQTEIDTGMSSFDTGFVPFRIEEGIQAGQKKVIDFIASAEGEYTKDAGEIIEKARHRAESLLEKAKVWGEGSICEDDFLKRLIVSADNFIAYRASTNGNTILAGLPWFTDWGRDTMISFTGLCLETRRFEEAKSILQTFVKYEKNGLLPNMFPDNNQEPIYNTADASLWFFYCVYQYLRYVNTSEAFEFVKEEIYPTLKLILQAYRMGTDFSIEMDKDGLVRAGSDLDQVTWMDVRVDGKVITPRHGKPVEINALWYNALKTMEALATKYEDKEYAASAASLAKLVKESFCKRFWNERQKCLFDVVDEVCEETRTVSDNPDIRCNQIWAVSLPFTMLDAEKEKAVVNTVLEKLYTDFGLRSLSPEDPEYHGVYFGKLKERDEAYHQGTVWAFPLGAFISAFLKVNGYSTEAKDTAKELLLPMKKHLDDGCINGIAEIFDGDAPHISRGCYSQAWSVGEILRAYKEVIS